MDDAKFDRLARAFEKTVSRRWLLALAGGVISLLRSASWPGDLSSVPQPAANRAPFARSFPAAATG